MVSIENTATDLHYAVAKYVVLERAPTSTERLSDVFITYDDSVSTADVDE